MGTCMYHSHKFLGTHEAFGNFVKFNTVTQIFNDFFLKCDESEDE